MAEPGGLIVGWSDERPLYLRDVAVPRDALVVRADGLYVYRIQEGQLAQRVTVTTGLADADRVSVEGTLSAGDAVESWCAAQRRCMMVPREDHWRKPDMGVRTTAVQACILAFLTCASAAQAAETERRLIQVSGEGLVMAQPDRAKLVMGVTEMTPELADAQATVNRVVRDCLSEFKRLGATERQISTSGASIQPEYVWDQQRRAQTLVGYRVSREIVLKVDDLARLGDFMLRATAAGVNQMQPPALESSQAEQLQQQALVKAAQAARAKAALLAETLGVRLGPLFGLQTVEQGNPRPVALKMARESAAFDGGEEAGLSFGEIQYRASVDARFDLIVP